jgi:hypothetical protein
LPESWINVPTVEMSGGNERREACELVGKS